MNEKIAITLLKIRYFEESLDSLFEKGKIFGTYHRCIGQEATAIGFTHSLSRINDYVVSNHRNHGHYLSFTGDYIGLLNELKGKSEGVSGGRGGSQVILGNNFISNGILGSTISLATGISFAKKRLRDNGIVVCFMGDGALGEGVVYESFNMASLWNLPIIYVLELNKVAQSTALEKITAGSIQNRFKAFGIKTKHIATTDVFELNELGEELINDVRGNSKPVAIIVEADRLCAHSNGDDNRNKDKIRFDLDPILILKNKLTNYDKIKKQAQEFITELTEN